MTLYRAPDGTTVETMRLSMTSNPADEGDWLVAKHPNGIVLHTLENQRGWVRTPAELEVYGIDLGDLVEICCRCRQPLPPKEK